MATLIYQTDSKIANGHSGLLILIGQPKRFK